MSGRGRKGGAQVGAFRGKGGAQGCHHRRADHQANMGFAGAPVFSNNINLHNQSLAPQCLERGRATIAVVAALLP